MASILKVDTIQDQDGNNIINESGDTITIGASGDTVNVVGTLQNNGNNAVGITEADQWRLSASLASDADPISSNLERVDNTGFGYIGTGMSVSSGIWTFPTTGLYLIRANSLIDVIPDDNVVLSIATTTDNSSYSDASVCAGSGDGSAIGSTTVSVECLFNVTNTATHKVKFKLSSVNSGSSMLGNTSFTYSGFLFIRLGDSV